MVQMTDSTQDILDAVFGNEEERQRLADAWKSLPQGQPLPDTPEVRALVLDLFIGMYGEAWKELAEQ